MNEEKNYKDLECPTCNKLHQGSELEKGQSFIVVVCDKEDIQERAKSNEKPLTKKQLDLVYEYLKRKMSDIIMEDFWLSIDAGLDQLKFLEEIDERDRKK